MSRRSLIGGLSFSMLARRRAMANIIVRGGPTGPGPGLSPDGSVIVGAVGGGSVGGLTLTTAYGTFGLGTVQAPHDGTNAGEFCMPMLNGKQCNPMGSAGAFTNPRCMRLRIDHGGRVYGVSNDQIWMQFGGYHWSDNYGQLPDFDYLSGPGLDPAPRPLPTYTPPYTASAENTSISGGTGSLVTVDGVWGFGTAGGGGWRPMLNGIEIEQNMNSWWYYDQMTVYGHGQMFLHRSDTPGWYLWAMYQGNPSTGPTAAAVPIDITVTPSRPSVPNGTPVDTFVCSIASVMSDGAAGSGPYALDDTSLFKVVGSNVLVSSPPPSPDFHNIVLSSTVGGSTLQTIVNFGVS
jgi:hypothetical protein